MTSPSPWIIIVVAGIGAFIGGISAWAGVHALRGRLRDRVPELHVTDRTIEFGSGALVVSVGNTRGTAKRYVVVVHAGDAMYWCNWEDPPIGRGTYRLLLRLSEKTFRPDGQPLVSTEVIPLIILSQAENDSWWYRDFRGADMPWRREQPYRELAGTEVDQWLQDQCAALRLTPIRVTRPTR